MACSRSGIASSMVPVCCWGASIAARIGSQRRGSSSGGDLERLPIADHRPSVTMVLAAGSGSDKRPVRERSIGMMLGDVAAVVAFDLADARVVQGRDQTDRNLFFSSILTILLCRSA